MTSTDSTDPTGAQPPLGDVARNPAAFARYLASLQQTMLQVEQQLETLQRETRVHCRGEHVEGDRFYHARLRAMPVERALRDVLKHLHSVTEGLEKSAYKRNAFADELRNLPGQRHQKQLEKQQKKGKKTLTAVPDSEGGQAPTSGYADPTSIFDLSDRESA